MAQVPFQSGCDASSQCHNNNRRARSRYSCSRPRKDISPEDLRSSFCRKKRGRSPSKGPSKIRWPIRPSRGSALKASQTANGFSPRKCGSALRSARLQYIGLYSCSHKSYCCPPLCPFTNHLSFIILRKSAFSKSLRPRAKQKEGLRTVLFVPIFAYLVVYHVDNNNILCYSAVADRNSEAVTA